MIPGMNGSLNSGGQAALPRAPAPRPYTPQVAGPPNYTTYNRTYPQPTHITAPGRTGVNTSPGGGPSGATQARNDAAAAAAYARQVRQLGLGQIGNINNYSTGHTPPPNISGPGGTNPGLLGPSGGGSGIPGGGQGGPSPTFKLPTAPKTPALDTYLKSDAAYQNQLRTFAQALAEFQAGQQRTTASDNTSWQGATRQLGDQKVKDLAGIMNDFASRGMLKSGLYGQGVADYTKTYQNNLNDLNTGHSNALRDLGTANVNFQKDQAIQSAQARADAAARRAAQFGL